jgi:hypothetical protein
MPLITCPDCQTQVSDAAPACPKCGRPMADADAAPSKAYGFLIFGVVLIVLGGGAYYVGDTMVGSFSLCMGGVLMIIAGIVMAIVGLVTGR